jgi:hypothetical protein
MRIGKKSISLMLSKENKNLGLKNIFSLFESQFWGAAHALAPNPAKVECPNG